MKRSWMWALLVVLVLSSAIWVAAAGDAKAGKAVYTAKCAMCHGPNGEGKEAIGKAMGTTMRDLGSKEVQAKSDDQLKKDATEGVSKMKPVKLADKDADDVVAFIRTLAKK